MNNQTIYWVWLQQALGYSSHRLEKIVERFTFAEDFFRAPLSDKARITSLSRSEYERMKNTSLASADAIIKRCQSAGIDIIAYGDAAYPELLKQISAPPAVLYVRGRAEVLSDELCVAMVGTRKATMTGREIAFRFAYDLARSGVCVVSGGAVGIDTQSHRGALNAGGKTVCVLGCGHESGYLRELDHIKKSITLNGAVISEYPPDISPSKITFPQRNRIISGLSRGVLVVEAGKRSGSLITVNLALEQGRDVFAVPGSISNPYSYGTNDLIKDGAKPVTTAEDILCEYRGVSPAKEKKHVLIEKTAPQNVTKPSDDHVQQELFRAETSTAPVPVETSDEELDLPNFFGYISYAITGSPASELPERAPKKATDAKTQKQSAAPTVKAKSGSKPKTAAPKKAQPPKQIQKEKQEKPKQEQKEEKKTVQPTPSLDGLSKEAMSFYKALENGELHIDAIAEKTRLPISKVHAAATELEMNDLIVSLQGRRYRINNDS